MNRRDALRYTSLILGYSVSGSVASSLLQGCAIDRAPDWTPTFFDKAEAEKIDRLVDLILPATDTPGGWDVGVPPFIDQIVNLCYEPMDQTKMKAGLASLDDRSMEVNGKPFMEAGEKAQLALLNELKALNEQTLTNPGLNDEDPEFFGQFMGLAISGYLSSEKVGEEVLRYLPIPNEYQSCMDMEPGTRIWSL